MQRKFDLVVFDLDGTLIDGRKAIGDNFNHTLKIFGFPQLEREQIHAMIGTPLVEMFEKALPPSSRHLAPKMIDTFSKRAKETNHIGTIVLSGVIPTLENMRKDGFKLAVATSRRNDLASPLLERLGLHEYFDLANGCREGMRNKPHPDMINYVMKELNVEPRRTVMVGDTPLDILTAKNASIYAIAVTSSIELGMTTLDKIRDAGPDAIISSLLDLPGNLHIK